MRSKLICVMVFLAFSTAAFAAGSVGSSRSAQAKWVGGAGKASSVSRLPKVTAETEVRATYTPNYAVLYRFGSPEYNAAMAQWAVTNAMQGIADSEEANDEMPPLGWWISGGLVVAWAVIAYRAYRIN